LRQKQIERGQAVRFHLSLLIGIVLSNSSLWAETRYRVSIDDFTDRSSAVTAVQSLEAIGLKDASVVECTAGFSIQLSDLSHEDLAYGYMARLRREGFVGVSLTAVETSEAASKGFYGSEEVRQFEEKTLVDRHVELLGSGSSRSEAELWAAVDALVPDTTGKNGRMGLPRPYR
jgi:hypothetical protein